MRESDYGGVRALMGFPELPGLIVLFTQSDLEIFGVCARESVCV